MQFQQDRKNKSIRKCKKGIAQREYMVTVLWTGSERFGHALSTTLHGLPPNFTHALKFCLGRFLSPFQSASIDCVAWRALQRRTAGGSASGTGCVSQHFCSFASGRCHSNVIPSVAFRKPAFPIRLADRNGLKNLSRENFSACVKFGGNPCRDVETA